MSAKAIFLGALLLLAAGPTLAQSSGYLNVVGTVDAIDAASITVQTDPGGSMASFNLAPTWYAVENKPATLADIKPDDFVASAAVRGTDGKLHSTELRIFPAAMRGVGEGQRPMNDVRQQTMTNAIVAGTAVVNGSDDIEVKFAGGESELILDPSVPVTRIEVVDKSLVKPGAKVRLQGVRDAHGGAVNSIAIQ